MSFLSSQRRKQIHTSLEGLSERNQTRKDKRLKVRVNVFRFKILSAIREGRISTLEEARRFICSLRGARATEETIAELATLSLPGGPTLIFMQDHLAGYCRFSEMDS